MLGGFYGSGGSRATGNIPVQKPGALAQQADIQELSRIMKEVEHLDNEIISLGTVVNARSIEVKARRKKLICNPNVAALLDRLEMKGQPVWGLSSAERDMVREARSKYISS